jgi:hypothetical protein
MVCALCFSILIPVFVALLALSLSLFSDTLILSHLREDEPQFREAAKTEAGEAIVPDYGGLQLDMDSECTGLSLNLGDSSSLIHRLVASPTKEGCGSLVLDMEHSTITHDWDYFRFWHGYQVYVRAIL